MTEDKKKYSWSDLKDPIEVKKGMQDFDAFVVLAERTLGTRYKILNPDKPYLLWCLNLIDVNQEIYRKAALLKLAMDCKIPGDRIADMENQAAYDFIGNHLVALMSPDCLTSEEKIQYEKTFRYLE